MATVLEHSGFDPDRKLKVVGTNPIKHDGVDKVTGRAQFGADTHLPGMLVGKVLRSPHPHAILKSIDTSAAEALAGVKSLVTRDDFLEMPPGPLDGLGRELRQIAAVACRGDRRRVESARAMESPWRVPVFHGAGGVFL